MAFTSKRTKQWFACINGSKNMLWLLATPPFLETIILPIPIELVLIPLMAVNRQRIWAIAAVTTLGCLAASIVGYGVGMVLYQSLGTWFIEFMGMEQSYQAFQGFFDQYGFAVQFSYVLPLVLYKNFFILFAQIGTFHHNGNGFQRPSDILRDKESE